MSTALLFVTAPNADFKTVNRFLLYARDWEYGAGDSFHVITSKNDPEFENFKDSRNNQVSTTKPGDLTADNFNNEWVNTTVQELEKYVLDADSTGIDGNEISLFFILDEQGVRDQTCIIAESHTEWNDDADPPEKIPKEEMEMKYDFNKYRAPWDEVYIVFANLSIGNMDFEDYADEDGEADENGWWKLQGHGSFLDEEQVERREEEIRRLEGEGLV